MVSAIVKTLSMICNHFVHSHRRSNYIQRMNNKYTELWKTDNFFYCVFFRFVLWFSTCEYFFQFIIFFSRQRCRTIVLFIYNSKHQTHDRMNHINWIKSQCSDTFVSFLIRTRWKLMNPFNCFDHLLISLVFPQKWKCAFGQFQWFSLMILLFVAFCKANDLLMYIKWCACTFIKKTDFHEPRSLVSEALTVENFRFFSLLLCLYHWENAHSANLVCVCMCVQFCVCTTIHVNFVGIVLDCGCSSIS